MAADNPKQITAGDDVALNFQASIFTGAQSAKVVVNTGKKQLDFDVDLATGKCVLPGDKTKTFPAGRDSVPWALLIVDSDNLRSTHTRGFFWVLADMTAKRDQTFNEKALANVEEAILKLSKGTNLMISIGGQNYTKKNLKDLLTVRDLLQARVDAELSRIGATKARGPKKIRTRF